VPQPERTDRGILFDLDGVLIDSERLYYRAYSAVLADFGVSVTPEVYGKEWISAGMGPEYAVRTFDLPITPEEVRARKNPIFSKLLREEVALMPGAREALVRLSARFPIVLATNSRENDVAMVMERFGLREYFTDVVTRGRYANPKPAPDAFVTAAAAIGLPNARCVVIEDAWKGVKAASVAGSPIIAVPHEFTAADDFSLCARVVGHLDDVTAELVEELTAP
jgi:HAD superfamily hydrolase (TIGR01509 family)